MKKNKRKRIHNNVGKCDVIIPVYNAPEWVKLCVYSLFVNTPKENLGKVYLMNDNSNEGTVDCLRNLKNKYPEYIEIVTNDKNLGFVKNTNKGMKLSSANYVLLLNSDCLVSKNTIPKLISHIVNNPKIGLISPVASNAANVTLEMFEGFSYTQMDSLLEKKFLGMNFDACTIVGNCLLITRECIKRVGFLDEAYGMGYGEETDYHFNALSKGFESKIAIDTYVFHKAEASFGKSTQKDERIAKNRELFFSRWGKQYDLDSKEYEKNDPIKYIEENISDKDKEIVADTLFFLPFITQSAGGCHTVYDMVNYLAINGYYANILYEIYFDYKEIALFKPIHTSLFEKVKTKQVVATIWLSTFLSRKIVKGRKIPIINFVQGYENYFENGSKYSSVELTHKIADYEITISEYLKTKINKVFGRNSTLIQNGINCDLLYHENKNKKAKSIAFVLRNNPMKGDYLLLDIIKQIDNEFSNLQINVVYMDKEIEIPELKNNELHKILGPVSRLEISEILKKSDIYVDASVNEGFGLIGLEAMACGAVPIVSNSFGILEYMKDGENGFVINEINNSDQYLEKISEVINNESLFQRLKQVGANSCKSFDYDLTVQKYIEYFSEKKVASNSLKVLNKKEMKIVNKWVPEPQIIKEKGFQIPRSTRNIIPFFIRKAIKKVITKLYRMLEDS